MFDAVRKVFAATPEARKRGYTASRFSFDVAEGRYATCQGEGFVAVELLFLPGTYAPCPTSASERSLVAVRGGDTGSDQDQLANNGRGG